MRKIKVSTAAGISVLICMLTLSLLAWPLGRIKHTEKSGSSDKAEELSGPVDALLKAQQTFVPRYADLQAIHVYIASELDDSNTAVLNVVIFNKNLEIISAQDVLLAGKSYPGYAQIPTQLLSFTAGERYYYLVSAPAEPLVLAYAKEQPKTPESLETYYDSLLQEGKSLLTVYEYKAPFVWQDALLLALLCVLASAVLAALVELFCKICRLKLEVPLRPLLQTDAAAITAAVSLAAFIMIGPLQMFTKSIVNIVVLEIGILILAASCLYLIYRKDGWIKMRMPKTAAAKAALFICHLQKFAFAGAILACCHYGNALDMQGQKEASAWIFGCFGAAILCGVLLGVCSIVRSHARGKKRRMACSVSYALLIVLLFALLIIWRNERSWVFKAVIPFALFYFAYIFSGNPKNIMKNLADGIIISFIMLAAYCLVHRPYHYYRYNRYPMYFHTVTVTGMYLILVVCAAFAKFLAAEKRNFLPRLLMLGVTVSYLLMAVSRIGIAAISVIFVSVSFFTAFFAKEEGAPLGERLRFMLLEGGKRLGFLLLSIIWCLPACFTAARIIPAAAMQPQRTQIEEFALMITEETPMDSDLYITFPKFLDLMLNRISTNADEITWQDLFRKKEQAAASLSENETAQDATDIADAQDAQAQTDPLGQLGEADYEDAAKDYSNGRRDTWKLYWDSLTVAGHPTMQADPQIAHAHNTYLQAAYDHGIPFGVLFFVFYLLSGIKSVHYYVARRQKDAYAVFPMIIILAFGMTGVVEWVFHPCIPLGFAFLAVQAPLIMQPLKKRKQIRQKQQER